MRLQFAKVLYNLNLSCVRSTFDEGDGDVDERGSGVADDAASGGVDFNIDSSRARAVVAGLGFARSPSSVIQSCR